MNRQATPFLSVCICTYNRDRFIENCLRHLAAQTLDTGRWEAIVVDNHSTDRTAAIVQDFLQQHPLLPMRYVFEPRKGLANARNRGIAEAAGDIIVYIDDDAEAKPDFLEVYARFFEAHPQAGGAGGKILPLYTEAPEPKWISRWLDGFLAKVDIPGPTRPYRGRMKYPFGCNMAYRKTLLEKVGGFTTEISFRGDDKYIYYAVSRLPAEVWYVPEAVVGHNIPAGRLRLDYFRTLFLKTGNEEKQRLKAEGGVLRQPAKLLEYVFKLGVSAALWIGYAVTGREIKGRYIFLSQWYTLLGFLQKDVPVR